MNGASDEDEISKPEDTMTLKSLYLRDRPESTTSQSQENTTNKSKVNTIHEPSIEEKTVPTPSPSTPIVPPPSTSSPPYSPSTLTSLSMRYEPPSPFSRWDTPLFTLPTSDPHPPYDLIWTALFPPSTIRTSKKALSQSQSSPQPSSPAAVKPNAATILPPPTPASALQTLESTTQLVTSSLLAAYRASSLDSSEGGQLSFTVSGPDLDLTCTLTLPPNQPLSQPMLQRLRRKYTGLQRGGMAHGVGAGAVQGGRKGVVEGFVGFLGREFGDDG